MSDNISTRQIGPNGVFPPDDPDGSKARKELTDKGLFDVSGEGSSLGPLPPLPTPSKRVKDVYVGLDLSLTGTGFCMKRGTTLTIETIKTEPKDFKNDLDRLIHIRDTILLKIDAASVKMICVEDFFTPSNSMQIGSAIKLAMLGTAVRMALHEHYMPFVIIAPNSLKKHILGKGNGDKCMVVREVFKKYGIDVKDDNQADAVVLSYLAEHISQALSGKKMDDIPKYQQEVVSGLLSSIEDRGYNL